ncbi:hypothetical protein ACFQ4T_21640 [Streptomyces rhizosphaericus]|uniref:hypothetical protein n=1 Tax=Streptomyces rhizosphaericus TaxID=114699 RepID=UPI0036305460
MAPYRDQAAAGGLPGPRRAGQPGQPGDRESERGGAAADAPNAAARAARASAIAAYAAGARAAARANVDAATRSPHAPEPAPMPAPAPAPEPDPEPVTGGARWPGRPEAAESAQPSASEGPSAPEGGSWDSGGATGGGPATALAAERARQARIVVVGAVTERWAPEQAGPVHENWRLAPPVGPAADLWALGALLFRAVQGHAPYPEENAAELVQMVCGEAPAYAEECGPLRPVVESLMRQDPTERPDFEELRGWLRSLIRSAPEPDVGISTVTVPSLGSSGASDPRRLPIVRRRGWLVRRGRGRRPTAAVDAPAGHARHRRDKREKRERREPRETRQAPPAPPTQRKPRRLGRMLLLLILLGLAAAVLYAMMFLPRSKDDGGQERTGSAGAPSAAPHDPADGDKGDGDEGRPESPPTPSTPATRSRSPPTRPGWRRATRSVRTPRASRSPSTRAGPAGARTAAARSATSAATSSWWSWPDGTRCPSSAATRWRTSRTARPNCPPSAAPPGPRPPGCGGSTSAVRRWRRARSPGATAAGGMCTRATSRC